MNTKKSMEKQYASIIDRLVEVTAQYVESKVPESGNFTPVIVRFSIPGRDQEGRMFVQPSLTAGPEYRRVQIGVNQTGSDRLYSNYMVHDTKEKILEYLRKEETKPELIECYKHLSDRADED